MHDSCRITFYMLLLIHTIRKNGALKTGDPPRIFVSDVTALTVIEGETVRLPCKVSGQPYPIISWLKNGERIREDSKIYSRDQLSLIIAYAQKSDAGTFICEAVNGFGKQHVEYQVTILGKHKHRRKRKLTKKPVFSQPVKMRQYNIVERYGNTVKFRCKAKGRPRPQIEWYKDGNLTAIGQDGNKTKSKWTLILSEVTPQHNGRYTCRVWNIAGEITFDYNLQVRGHIRDSPVLLKPHPVNTTVIAGERTSIQCLVRSPVRPTIKWIKRLDNQAANFPTSEWPNKPIIVEEKSYLILPTQEMMLLPDGTYLNKLVIKAATLRDAGMYICFGANTMGYNFRYAYLTVLPDTRSNLPENLYRKSPEKSLSLPIIIGIPAGIGLLIVCTITMYCFFKRDHFGSFVGFVQRGDIHGANITKNSKVSNGKTHTEQNILDVTPRKDKNSETFIHPLITNANIEVANDGQPTMLRVYPLTEAYAASRPLLSIHSTHGDVGTVIGKSTDALESESGFSSSPCNRPPPPPPPSQNSFTSSSATGNSRRHHHNCQRLNRCRHHHGQSRSFSRAQQDSYVTKTNCTGHVASERNT
uniref:receptor protein-tyrosine kinase n=1 Tax=Phallusia mammillata TaxID=59560 RepID=A0A6F9DC98_9ASCI|nr:fibroblast growth factor receptor-like 1 [Phallusia mammillata]